MISRVFVALGVAEALEYPRQLMVEMRGRQRDAPAPITPEVE